MKHRVLQRNSPAPVQPDGAQCVWGHEGVVPRGQQTEGPESLPDSAQHVWGPRAAAASPKWPRQVQGNLQRGVSKMKLCAPACRK